MNNHHPHSLSNAPKAGPHVVLWPSSACLVTELLSELANFLRPQLERTLIILPTQRLCSLVLASLAERLGALIPPKIQTLEQFIAEQSAVLNEPKQLVGDFDAQLILGELIASKGYKQVSQDHAGEVLQLFKELIAEEIGSQCFDKLRDKLKADFSKSEAQIESLLRRCDELGDLRTTFFETLHTAGQELFPEFLQRAAKNLTSHWRHDCFPFEHAYIIGFTSFTATVFELINWIAAQPCSQLWISQSPLLLSKAWPLDTLRKRFGAALDKSEVLPKDATLRLVPVHACHNQLAEVASCLRRVEEEIKSGVAPSQIAILLTNEQEYGSLLRSLMSVADWSPNFAVSIRFSQTPTGRFLRSLVQVFLQNEAVAAVIDFFANPLTAAWFIDQGALAGITARICEAMLEAGIPVGLEEIGDRIADPELKAWFHKGADLLKTLRNIAHQNLYEASQILKNFLNDFAALEDEEWEGLAGVRASTEEILENFWQSIQVVYGPEGTYPHGNQALSLWQLLKTQLFSAEVRGLGEPLHGVQVLSLSEARYVPFRRVFVLGCSEGNLPKSLPQDDLLDDYLKRSLGLSGWRNLIALEETTVMLLRDRLERLELFYSTERVGDLAVRSRYIDQFMIDESAFFIRENDSAFASEALNVAAVTTAKCEGLVKDTKNHLAAMSATALEKLLHCPYRFLLDQLQVEPLSIPVANDPRLQGQWLHQVMEHFFYELPKELNPKNFSSTAMQLLAQLTAKFAPKDFKRSWLHHHLSYFAWPRFVEHVATMFFAYADNSYLGGDKEIRFGRREPSWLSEIVIANQSFVVKGAIDSIDYFSKFSVITDYKRKSIPPPASVQQGLNPQLGFYLLALINARHKTLPTSNVIAGYWSILEGIWVPAFASEALKEQEQIAALIKTSTPRPDAIMTKISNLWQWRLNEVATTARFYADPSRCERCGLATACRRDEPSEKERLLGQQRLKHYLAPPVPKADSA